MFIDVSISLRVQGTVRLQAVVVVMSGGGNSGHEPSPPDTTATAATHVYDVQHTSVVLAGMLRLRRH
jgi:hypothetical protein